MFKHQIRIPYRDVTLGNHVYYARYLDFLEVARNEVFRILGCSLIQLQEQGVIFPVVECSLRYHEAARYDDLIHIETLPADLGRVQFSFNYNIKREETLILTAMTRHAVTNLDGKPIRMPDELHHLLLQHIKS